MRFLGYDPANIKIVAYVIAALMASIAGALFVPIVGIISPDDVGIVASIAFLIGRRDRRPRPRCSGRCSARSAWPGRQTTLSETLPVGLDLRPGLRCSSLVIAFLPGGLASLGGAWSGCALGCAGRRRRARPGRPGSSVDPVRVRASHARGRRRASEAA